MKSKFVEKESHKHRLAKELLASWCLDQEKNNDSCSVAQFSWRQNYGVFTELKFYETSDPYYFELSQGIAPYKVVKGNHLRSKNPLEWFDPKFNRGNILFVPDITIFHKGSVMIIFEVIHSNPVSYQKLEAMIKFFDGNYIELYEIEAEEILRHTGIPEFLKVKRLI